MCSWSTCSLSGCKAHNNNNNNNSNNNNIVLPLGTEELVCVTVDGSCGCVGVVEKRSRVDPREEGVEEVALSLVRMV